MTVYTRLNPLGECLTSTIMSDMPSLETRLARAKFRAWHRGTREMDMILGGFADVHIAALSDADLDDLEGLMELPDPDLYAAFSGAQPLASPYKDGIFVRIKQFLDTSRFS